MAIKRVPSQTMFRILRDGAEQMRFRAKSALYAKVHARKQTALLRKQATPGSFTVERYSEGRWVLVGPIE